MQIKCLAQGHNILMQLGLEPPIYVSQSTSCPHVQYDPVDRNLLVTIVSLSETGICWLPLYHCRRQGFVGYHCITVGDRDLLVTIVSLLETGICWLPLYHCRR